ncbi:MAG: rRNA maturation RNase YbeY [Candidatus Shikimatogenerans sp. JK-2022]|nr:rRNA maturation RNase YbeY [Candidatus Shikimatogenerans bostrichidophilus]
MINIYFLKKIKIYKLNLLKKKIKEIVNLEGKKIFIINYIFCNNKYILYINKKYLNKKYYTDTISFNYNYFNNKIIYGDIYISVDQVLYNTIVLKNFFSNEIKKVIIHSLLHLLGYNDNNLINKILMINKENIYLKKINNIIINYEKI